MTILIDKNPEILEIEKNIEKSAFYECTDSNNNDS